MKPLKLMTLFLSGVLVFTACGDQVQSTDSDKEETTQDPPAGTDNNSANQLYTWVDNLNVRSTPELDGKVVATVKENEAITFTDEKSAEAQTIVLRGVAYYDHWVKIKTTDNTEGWVFGGAVKGKHEEKGTAALNDEQFSFPHFGSFDLSEWEKVTTDKSGGGDAETEETTYKKDNRILKISNTDVGEYGYTKTHTLFNNYNKRLKERSVSFNIGMGLGESTTYNLTETVDDYTKKPYTKYTRSQVIRDHFMMLNARPIMATGEWTESKE
ncbi:MAG: SH3 domain-containing protein [Bacteroidota bacterium]